MNEEEFINYIRSLMYNSVKEVNNRSNDSVFDRTLQFTNDMEIVFNILGERHKHLIKNKIS